MKSLLKAAGETFLLTSAQDQLVKGHATYGMANLRPDRTGLPFIVSISQRDDAHQTAGVKVSWAPRVKAAQIGSYSIAPFALRAGQALSPSDECALEGWVALNLDVLQRYWNGDIEFTEDALAQLSQV